MRKMKKFADGGETTEMISKPYSALEDLSSGKEKGSFDEDTYARARRFLERGEQSSAKPRATVAPAGTPGGAFRGQRADAGSAEIPKGSEVAPASTGEDTSGPSNLDRILMGAGAGAGVAGAAKLAQMRRAKQAAETAKAAAAKFSQPQARQATAETGRRFGPKAEMEAAESTMRGAVGRRDIQAKRAAKERAESAEGKSSGRTGSTGAPRSRNTVGRDEEMTSRNFSSGGKVRGGGCEMRGKTRGVMR